MEVKGVQREGSTLSHTPDELQVLLITVVVLGQRRDWMVSAGVSGQERNSVISASQKTVSPGGMVMWKDMCTCDEEEEEAVYMENSKCGR